jgi:hypothetical protein
MSDQQQHNDGSGNRPDDLREISHLFLSTVRDLQTGGARRPTRIPPGGQRRPDASIDLTPEEFAQMCGGGGASKLDDLLSAPDDPSSPTVADAGGNNDITGLPGLRQVPVTAVLAAHLNGSQFERVKQYARHLAARVGRVGLIELDAGQFRLLSFEPTVPATDPSHHDEAIDPALLGEAMLHSEAYDLSHVAEAINEMHEDVAHWLLLLPSPRTPEARAVLRQIDHWVMLSTCDHDGVVGCYRTIKSLADLFRHTANRASTGADSDLPGVPTLSLATFADDDSEAQHVYQKIGSVCSQFLHWPIACDARVLQTADVAEHLIMSVHPTHDKAQLASSTQWEIVSSFLVSVQPPLIPTRDVNTPTTTDGAPDTACGEASALGIAQPQETIHSIEQEQTTDPFKMVPAMNITNDLTDDVVDLGADGDDSAGALLSSICRHEAGALVECPIRPPMCPDARLAVDRNHGLILLACARRGLGELKLVGKAYAWLIENRALVAMALPQLGVDAHPLPRLRLIVDQADLSAESLQTLVQSGSVTVQSYRKLRWGGRTGVLLQAA